MFAFMSNIMKNKKESDLGGRASDSAVIIIEALQNSHSKIYRMNKDPERWL